MELVNFELYPEIAEYLMTELEVTGKEMAV